MKRIFAILALISALALPCQIVSARTSSAALEVAADVPSARPLSGAIELQCPPDDVTYTFQIYSITGQLVKTIRLHNGTALVELPQGCYIVRCQKWSKKIIVG